MRTLWAAIAFILLGGVLFGATGCATQKIDWNGRVGTYSYDDAVRELGPPDKSAKLSDESMVADWLTGRGMQTATGLGFGPGPYGGFGHGFGYGVGGPHVIVMDPPTPNRFLRLTFDPKGKLASWQRVYQ